MVNLELNMRVLQNICSNCDLQMAGFEGVILFIRKRCPSVGLFDKLCINYELASLSVVFNIIFLRLLRPRNLFFPGSIQCATLLRGVYEAGSSAKRGLYEMAQTPAGPAE